MSSPLSLGPPLTEVTRRDLATGAEVVESIHPGHLVLVDPDGRVAASAGDPDARIFVRSAAKPFQAIACLEVLADRGAGLSDAEVAISWASHRGEPQHLEAVAALLARSGTAPDELTCPPATAEVAPGAPPSPIQHNCSGKHAMFALAGAALGAPRDQLLHPRGLLQRYLLEELSQRMSIEAAGVDGCGAPAVVAPLVALARAYAGLAGFPWGARVRAAGIAHPGLIGGERRLESALLAAGVVAKVGAEGVYGVGWTDADGAPWGLAVKATDGSTRGAATAVVAALEGIGVVGGGTWAAPRPLGGGRPAGTIRPTAAVRECVAAIGSRATRGPGPTGPG